MKKTIKIVGLTLAIVVVLLLAAAIVVSLVVDPNQYKGQIIKVVKDQTGRDLKIDGDIKLALFPWIGAELPALALSNAPGFGDEPFARVKSADIKVRLLPLLRKEIVVRRVALDGLRLNLARDRAGQGNWEGLTGKPQDKAVAKAREKAEPTRLAAVTIGAVTLRDAEIRWRDEASGQAYALKRLDISTGEIAPARPTDLRLAFDLESGTPPVATRVDLKARLAADLEKQTLDVPDLRLAMADMTVKLSGVKGTKILDAPAVSGTLDVAAFDAKALVNKLGIKIETADKGALTKLAVKSGFSASTNHIELKGLALTLDDTTLRGGFSMRDFARPAYRFDLSVDQINVDRYLAPAAAKKPAPAPAGKAKEAPIVVPLKALRELNADGALRIGKLTVIGIQSTDVNTRLTANGGQISLSPSKAKLYGGSYQGAIGIDARTSPLVLSADEKLSGVQIGPLLKDMEVFDNFSGTGDVSLKVNGRGLDAKAITRTLTGNAAFSLRDGAIHGTDLLKKIEEANALYKQLKGKPVQVKGQASEKTAFNVFAGSARITNGIAQNTDLKLETPGMRATGRGLADLVNRQLDYRLEIIERSKEGQKCANIPLRITGAFTDLSYAPDFEAILKCQAQKEIKKKLGGELEKLLKKRSR